MGLVPSHCPGPSRELADTQIGIARHTAENEGETARPLEGERAQPSLRGGGCRVGDAAAAATSRTVGTGFGDYGIGVGIGPHGRLIGHVPAGG